MKDIRMLMLFKQHYLNSYTESLDSEFSCWGYYDGLSVVKGREVEGKLIQSKESCFISNLWYNSIEKVKQLKGKYSAQVVGMFCDEDEVTKKFWNIYQRLPYIAVGFLQLKEKDQYKDFVKKIKNEYQQQIDENNKICVQTVVYYTFDNADLIVLMQSNSVCELEGNIHRIENEIDMVSYFHAIIGINEQYLKECDKFKRILGMWNDYDCFIQDKIDRIVMKLVTAGGIKIDEYVEAEWKYQDIQGKCAKVIGHENYMVNICDTNVSTLIRLLVPGGLSTHQNSMYKKGIYNIETGIRIDEEEWKLTKGKVEDDNKELGQWCQEKIVKYGSKMLDAWENGNEGLYSYYHSLLQTLNTLAQYENFELSKDIYYLIIPAFQLFDNQLEKALQQVEQDGSDATIEEIKTGMCHFIDSVNSLIYHTIHSDQIFLMVPGYTGTTFAVPVKLCLLYLWFINKVINLLNDSENTYRCLLVPEIESRPITDMISMHLPHGDRLICVKLSQRSLYMPRYLLVILAHELAHYVGDEIRCRKIRTSYIIRSTAAFLAYGIIHGCIYSVEEKGICDMLKGVEERLHRYLHDRAEARLKSEVKNGNYYDSVVKEKLEKIFDELLMDQEMEVSKICNEVSPEVIKVLKNNPEQYRANLQTLYEVQKKFDRNRKTILVSGVSRKCVQELSAIYKEVFSDVAACIMLKFDIVTFRDTFWISEGRMFEEDNVSAQQKMRELLVEKLIEKMKQEQAKKTPEKTPFISNEIEVELGDYSNLLKNLYSFQFIQDFLFKYVEACYELICKHMDDSDSKQEVEEIRMMFEMFGNQNKFSSEDIYETIHNKNVDYKKSCEKINCKDK